MGRYSNSTCNFGVKSIKVCSNLKFLILKNILENAKDDKELKQIRDKSQNAIRKSFFILVFENKNGDSLSLNYCQLFIFSVRFLLFFLIEHNNFIVFL